MYGIVLSQNTLDIFNMKQEKGIINIPHFTVRNGKNLFSSFDRVRRYD
jgi:hypothetical protein